MCFRCRPQAVRAFRKVIHGIVNQVSTVTGKFGNTQRSRRPNKICLYADSVQLLQQAAFPAIRTLNSIVLADYKQIQVAEPAGFAPSK